MTRGLFFDCDGVLAETELDGHRRAFNTVWQEEGVDWKWSRAAYIEALGVSGGHERLLALAHSAEFVAAVGHLSRFGDWVETTRRWHRRKTELLAQEICRFGVQPRPGVRRLAEEAAAAGWRLAVVSSGSPCTVTAIARGVLGDALFAETVMVTAQDVTAKKPAPDCYRVALERTGVDAADALAIEDSAHGLAAARGAAVACLVTVTRATAGQDFHGAIAVVDSLSVPLLPTTSDVLDRTAWRAPRGEVGLADVERLLDAAAEGRAIG